MTKTLEELYMSCGEDTASGHAYDRARAAKVAEIADYIRDYLREPNSAPAHAESVMASAEEMGRITGDMIGGEIRGFYTHDRNPLAFSI